MLTKKQLFEILADVPDDALIGAVQTTSGVKPGIFWGTNTDFSFIMDILKDAPYIPMSNQFNLDMLKK